MQIILAFDLKLTNQFDKVSTFSWKIMDLRRLIGHLKVIRLNNLH